MNRQVQEYMTEQRERHEYDKRQDDEDGISLRELLILLLRGKKIIAVATVILLLLTLFFSIMIPNINIGTEGEVQAAVKIYFEGIETGMKPDGTIFDPGEIKAPQILNRAVSDVMGDKKISISLLSESIGITEVLSDEAAQTLQNISALKSEDLKFEKLETLKFYPDTFILNFSVDKRLGMSLEEGRQILDAVIYQYRQWLTEEYGGYQVLPNLFANGVDIGNYDYIQAADLLSGELAEAETYIKSNLRDESFVSQSTGKSKEDLLNNISSVKEINIEMLYTQIATNYLTKDIGRSTAIYEKLAENKDILAAQKYEEAAAIMNMLQTYKKNEQITVLGNGMTESFVLEKGDETYDRLMERYVAAKASSSAAVADAAYYRQEALRFSQLAGTVAKTEALIKDTEGLITAAAKKAENEIKDINETVKDYYDQETYQKYAEQLLPAQDYHKESGVNIPLNMAVALAAGVLLGILIVLFKEYLGDRDEKQTV